MSTSATPWWGPLLQATRRNLIPGLALQALAMALVGAYYFLPATRGFFTSIAEAKNAGGYWFSAVAGVIAGGIIPWLVQYARGQIEPKLAVRDFFYVVAVWAWRGIEVDAFYRLQDWFFGNGHDPATLVKKVAVDQLLYAPLWACPLLVLAYRFRDLRFSWTTLRHGFTWREFIHQVLMVQSSSWMVWIPAVTIVYSLPSALQFPLFAVVVCFWSLLLATLTNRR